MNSAKASSGPLRLAVLISGGGTTLVNLQEQIEQELLPAEIVQVVANRACQGLQRATDRGLKTQLTKRSELPSLQAYSDALFAQFREQQIDLVILGGFLAHILIPADFEHRVMNIHPALLPAFGGQGMYGHFVHEAVLRRGCKVSGCTVHFCDDNYDAGPIIIQRTVPVLDDDTPDSLAARVFAEECIAFPEAIRLYAESRLQIRDGRVMILPGAAKSAS